MAANWDSIWDRFRAPAFPHSIHLPASSGAHVTLPNALSSSTIVQSLSTDPDAIMFSPARCSMMLVEIEISAQPRLEWEHLGSDALAADFEVLLIFSAIPDSPGLEFEACQSRPRTGMVRDAPKAIVRNIVFTRRNARAVRSAISKGTYMTNPAVANLLRSKPFGLRHDVDYDYELTSITVTAGRIAVHNRTFRAASPRTSARLFVLHQYFKSSMRCHIFRY